VATAVARQKVQNVVAAPQHFTLKRLAAPHDVAHQQFRRVKNYRHLPLLNQALQNRLSLTHSAAA